MILYHDQLTYYIVYVLIINYRKKSVSKIVTRITSLFTTWCLLFANHKMNIKQITQSETNTALSTRIMHVTK